MSQQNNKQSQKQKSLRKIVKILSKVSNVDTAEIRKDIHKSVTSKNKDRIKYHVEKDSLLKNKKDVSLPNALFTYKLFEDRGNKVGSIKQKKIESQACLKRVNFQYRKLQIKKQQIAKKHHLSEEKYRSVPQLTISNIQHTDVKNLRISQAFEKVVIPEDQDARDKKMIKRVKLTLNTSKNRVRTLYNAHCVSIKALTSTNRHRSSNPEIAEQKINTNLTEAEESPNQKNCLQDSNQNGFTKTQSVIVRKPETSRRKKQSLIDLIQLSRVRSDHKEERLDEKLTRKEVIDFKATNSLLHSLRQEIDRQNKLRESIVFGGLKKLLYGDRRGRFIQDNTFKTRLEGQNSPQYLSILRQQEEILTKFEGSIKNRRNLAQKFSNILGAINKHEKNVHQQKYKY